MTTTARGEQVLITGGAGFVATNVADRLLQRGCRVRLLDDLSRPGVERNVAWLEARYGDRVEFVRGDVRDPGTVSRTVAGTRRVFHLAAQVAVTTSLVDPVHDFEVNARGTLNVLEAVRALDDRPTLVFTSTNKVYGHLDDLALRACGRRYEPLDPEVAIRGISERRALDFHSPYGCSKGAAEQYVLDYARTFGVPATVLRMSCVYGPHQFGTEDQGWVAHFLIQALNERPLTLYGDGLQVRDVLYADDLVDAMVAAHEHIDRTRGEAFNIGGGSGSTVSLLETLDLIGALIGKVPEYGLEPWRPADQRYYVSDITKFTLATGWRPHVSVTDGFGRLFAWLTGAGLPLPRVAVAGRVAS
jgi:CDP-paratose 2-epimerase